MITYLSSSPRSYCGGLQNRVFARFDNITPIGERDDENLTIVTQSGVPRLVCCGVQIHHPKLIIHMTQRLGSSRFTALIGVVAVIFFFALLPFELIPEVPVDIDAKPFFVPLALAALLPSGRTGLAIGLGVALGEGLRDVLEGYELDDPIGFIGYVVGFWAASGIFAMAPGNRAVMVFGAIVCAGLQAVLEASSFLIFGTEAFTVAIQSAIGNTISHGIIFGAIPMVFLVKSLHGRFERYLGFAPAGSEIPDPLPNLQREPLSTRVPNPDAVAGLYNVSLRYPGQNELSLEAVTIEIFKGDFVQLIGPPGAGKKSLALALGGAAPKATGGELIGNVKEADLVEWIGTSPRDFMTQPRAVHQVATVVPTADGGSPIGRARAALFQAGLAEDKHDAYVWELDKKDLVRVEMASSLVRKAPLLIVDGAVLDLLSEGGKKFMRRIMDDQLQRGAVVFLAADKDKILSRPSRKIALLGGRIHDEVALDASNTTLGGEIWETADAKSKFPIDPDLSEGLADVAPAFSVPTLETRGEGWWQQRDPRVKWLLFISLILLIYLAPDWRWMAAMTIAGLVITLTARPNFAWLGLALFVQLPNIAGLILLPLLGESTSTAEELAFGLRLGLGWTAAILFGISLISTMNVPDLVSGLRGIGLPRKFAFVVGYSFVLIYLSIDDLSRVVSRMQSKGAQFNPLHPQKFISSFLALFSPVIETVARRGGAMSVALEVSGSGDYVDLDPKRSISRSDLALLTLAAAALAAAVWIRSF